MDNNPSSETAGGQIITQRKVLDYAEIEKVGKAFVASGMFGTDMDRVSKAVTKIMAGQELGLAPFASMRAVHVIEGNATLSANTMAGMVKSSGRYDYEIKKKTLTECEVEFLEIRGGKRVKQGVEVFTMDEARMAGLIDPECPEAPAKHNLRTVTYYKKGGGSWQKPNACRCKDNWKNYPKAMLFARCMSNGVRTYCPDVFSGMLVYTPDELNARVGGDGAVIDIDPETGEVQSAPEPKKSTKADNVQEGKTNEDPSEEAEPIVQSEGESSLGEEMPENFLKPDEDAVPITDDLKAEVLEHIETFNLSGRDKIRFIKECTGAVSPNMIKTDEQWRELHTQVMAVLNGERDLPGTEEVAE